MAGAGQRRPRRRGLCRGQCSSSCRRHRLAKARLAWSTMPRRRRSAPVEETRTCSSRFRPRIHPPSRAGTSVAVCPQAARSTGWRPAGPTCAATRGQASPTASCDGPVLCGAAAAACRGALHLAFPAISGFLIVGPFLASGLYEKAAGGRPARPLPWPR